MESSGWELHKENIQPLCSGRNISLLKQSLDTSKSMADHEQDIEQQLSELESNVQNYSGDDPIEPYLALIRFLEHQCVHTITWKKSLSNARMECYKKFYDNSLYKNDKRYVEAIVKCLNDAVPDTSSRLNLLLVALNKKEIGTSVSQMYIVIADHQESLGMKNEARQTMKRGITKDAQPIEKLQEAISELEFRIARDLAKSMNVGPQPSSNRNFGSSVPVHGEKNDAPVFRNDLKPAIPVMERQASISKLHHQVTSKSNLPLYQTETENDHPTGTPSSSSSVGFNIVEQVVGPKFDKENHQKPSKWNKPNVVVETDSPEMREFEAPREKIAIYTEDSVDDKPTRPMIVQEGILKERKPCSVLGPELQSTSSLALAGTLNNKQSVIADVNGTVDVLSTIELAPMIIPNACLKFSRSMLSSGRPASFEHRKRNAWLKSNQDREIIARLKNDRMQLEEKLIKVERDFEQLCEVEQSLRENFETELKQKAIKEAQWEQQRYSYNDTILRLTTECSELKDYVQQLELHQKEFMNILEEAKTRHWQELEKLKANHASQIKELTLQLQQQSAPYQASTTTTNNITTECNSNSAGDRQYSSSSNENECTYIKATQQQQQQQMSHYSSMAVPSDKLMNATGMSYMESFMAPPSHADQTCNNFVEISINRDPSFNASVRMSGATTVYGWNEKTRFCRNTSDDVDEDSPLTRDTDIRMRDSNATKNDTAPSFGAVMLPPPSVSKKFVLYESISDSNPSSKLKKPDNPQSEKPQGIDFRYLSENIAPPPHPVKEIDQKRSDNYVLNRRSTSVSARIAEIEAISNAADVLEEIRPIRHSRATSQENLATDFVGQTFVHPAAPRRNMLPLTGKKDGKFDDDADDEEPPFEPYVGRSRPSVYEPYRPPELPFDTSNLTSALQLGPPPLLNSTPERFSGGTRRLHSDGMFAGNYVHTQRIPSMTIGEIDGPMSPENEARRIRESMDWMQDRMQRLGEIRDHPIRDISESMQLNLSPIQETSKENRSGCTTSSSSGNMTSTRGGATISGVSMFTSSRSVSGGQRSTSSYRFTQN